jgi:hypothetical protein
MFHKLSGTQERSERISRIRHKDGVFSAQFFATPSWPDYDRRDDVVPFVDDGRRR